MTDLKPRGKCLPANYPIDINAELLKQHRILLQETQASAFFRRIFSSSKYSNIKIIDMPMTAEKLFLI